MEYISTPIGKIQMPEDIEKELNALSDEELLQRAINENKMFCISPAVYTMVEKRCLEFELQHRINPCVGFRKLPSFPNETIMKTQARK